MDFNKARKNMVDSQIHTVGVASRAVLDAFSNVPREIFVPEKLKPLAYSDVSLTIAKGRYLIEPAVYAKIIQAAHIRPDDIVMDIGVGSGYSSALLSTMVTTVVALDDNKKYLERASRLWDRLGACNVVPIQGDITKGMAEHAPYSLILINGAVAEIPEIIIDQLDMNGRLLAVVKGKDSSIGRVVMVKKTGEGKYSQAELFDAVMPYISGFEPEENFKF